MSKIRFIGQFNLFVPPKLLVSAGGSFLCGLCCFGFFWGNFYHRLILRTEGTKPTSTFLLIRLVHSDLQDSHRCLAFASEVNDVQRRSDSLISFSCTACAAIALREHWGLPFIWLNVTAVYIMLQRHMHLRDQGKVSLCL